MPLSIIIVIHKGGHSLIEMPTGTGKTVSINNCKHGDYYLGITALFKSFLHAGQEKHGRYIQADLLHAYRSRDGKNTQSLRYLSNV